MRPRRLALRHAEFGTVNSCFGERSYRYTYAATNEPGWFPFNGLVKHDTVTGREERYQFEPGVFCSEFGRRSVYGRYRRGRRVSRDAHPLDHESENAQDVCKHRDIRPCRGTGA